MKKRTAVIGVLVSLLPFGQPLLIGTVAVLTSAAVMLTVPNQAKAESAVSYFNQGNFKFKVEDYYGAIADYSKAIEIDPRYVKAYYNRGLSKERLEDYEAAIADYSKAIEIDPKFNDAYYNRGSVKDNLEDYYGAIADYSKAIEINPSYAKPYNNRCYVKRRFLKDYYGAISDCLIAKDLDPNNFNPYINLGFAKKQLGDMKGACADWRQASYLGHEKSSQRVRNEC